MIDANKLLREAFNAMDEVRCTLIDRCDPSGISSVLAMTLADTQRDIKAYLEEAARSANFQAALDEEIDP